MTRTELRNEYFQWMYRLVCDGKSGSYKNLLRYLYKTEFTYILPMDGNRAEDGVDLRYRFGHEYAIDEPRIASYLDDEPCSVLEMMVALAIRCEEHIMSDPDIGDRTSQWFWIMMDNLGLKDMTDTHFDRERVSQIIEAFLNRDYEPNGKGGLFIVDHVKRDMRSVEIWYQMNWYLAENA